MNILLMLRGPFIEANPDFIEKIKMLGNITILYTDNGIDKEKLKQEVKEIEVIVVAVVPIDKEIIDAAPKLKYIMKFGAGYDNIDFRYAREKGIPVTNTPGQNADAVADHAFGLMLATARQISSKNEELRNGHWELSMGMEIFQKKLGIIGFGAIGQAIAQRATGFQMDVLAYGTYQNQTIADRLNVKFVDLYTLLSESDIVVVSTTLRKENYQLINAKTLNEMKEDALFINVSRGPLVDEDALYEALKNGNIKGAGLDVFVEEPSNHPLLTLPNTTVTPHIGAATNEAIKRTGNVALENLQRFKDDIPLLHVVN
ncbi:MULTISPECIES: phosphoglycerate dehydrogenase [Oceanobacillus]|uniref:D-glycerate dehydrogenase n=1 Tax=Oceanobacillus kimchii TaxID=746691 RepID=A0ABQ5TJB4_9BACI|nr:MULTISPECIES: phosphoglycerate dehydrogenase [Oceanobacillus]MBT2600713.1 phosphoglycerate dehydrogenase [Oceanobacillus sp. ISL-74]MBT2650890.1 phosphoglycerate dehydrogenase [Oceanobacillus sp. ISL-73]OEH55286.1 glycerate dehydrogenase [Oceanobacillus sp. E9]GLO66953.1 D-glycerate dehydrogenase [Oceanobacillus kimchii]